MTNGQLVKSWKELAIKFNTSNEVTPLTDMFAICWGETETEIEKKKEKVVVFDAGNKEGINAVYCHSDKNDRCWICCWDSKKETGVRANIGRFVRYTTDKNPKSKEDSKNKFKNN